MALNISMSNQETQLSPRILVVGVGGAGGNAVNNMIRSNLEGVDFLVCNTDSQALTQSLADRKIQLGGNITKGLGAGSRPEIGRAAAEEALEEVIEHINGTHMVFVTAGMGGGTGTGAAPVIASAAREQGILTVGVITKPFHFEGQHRMKIAEQGIEELQQYVDTLIVIPNQNLFRLANENTTFADAFKLADNVLHSGVRGVTDLMVMPGLINLDFADIRTVMSEMGKAMMGTGQAEGATRATDAAEAAISNPLLDDVSMKGAKGVLINITGGMDMTLFEVDEAANRIRDEVDPNAQIIFGSTFEEAMDGKIRVSVVATGIEQEEILKTHPSEIMATNGLRNTPHQSSGLTSSQEETLELKLSSQLQAKAPSEDRNANLQRVPQARMASEMRRTEPDNTSQSADHFMTPEPMHSGDDYTPRTQSQLADPFATADMENAAQEKKGFFKKTFGMGHSTSAPHQQTELKTTDTVKHSEEFYAEDSQPTLEGLDTDENLKKESKDDEYLDIPTFLRRQAN